MNEIIIVLLVLCAVCAIYFYNKKKKGKDMNAGLQVFDKDGNVILDTTSNDPRLSSITKFLGEGDTGWTDGELNDPSILKKEADKLWVIPCVTEYENSIFSGRRNIQIGKPYFYINVDGKLTWKFPVADQDHELAKIRYKKFVYGFY